MKSLQCKQAIEPFYNLEKENSLYDCIDQYYSLATAARKKAFRYESDSDTSIPAYYDRIRRFFYWKEYHILEEVCLLSAIDLFTKQVRSTPCDVHLHARLANAYILLQNHFVEPMKAKKLMAWPSLFLTSHTKEEYQNKADKASRLAVTELDITSAFAPDEMWVHEQLAISYHELKMSQKEIEECEKLFQANSEDPHVLLRLGTLYFQSGQNGSGLKMYGLLKEIDPRLGQELISQYGSYTPFLEKNAL